MDTGYASSGCTVKSSPLFLALLLLMLSGCHSDPPRTRQQKKYAYDVAIAEEQAKALTYGDLYNPVVPGRQPHYLVLNYEANAVIAEGFTTRAAAERYAKTLRAQQEK